MMVPIKSAMMDAPKSPPGMRCSKRTEIPATPAQMAMPRKNNARSFAFEFIKTSKGVFLSKGIIA